MKRLIAVLALILPMAIPRAEIVLHDDRGRELALDAPAQRIVSLAPHLTELLFAAGAGSKLVGTVAYSDYPDQARDIPVVGNSASLDMERIVALKPDVVVAWLSGNPSGEIAKLEQLGLRVLVTEPRSLERIAEQITLFGRLAGTERAAAAAAAQFRRDFAALRREYQGRRKVSVFYQVWHEPLMTVNGKHVINEVIDLCGGKNIFAGLRTLAPSVSLEAVLAADPEAIVTGSEQPAMMALEDWRAWKNLRAVRNGDLITIPPDDISRPTPRILIGARRLCAQLDHVRLMGTAKQ
jgi:iron complex transport system substrate-binding protein